MLIRHIHQDRCNNTKTLSEQRISFIVDVDLKEQFTQKLKFSHPLQRLLQSVELRRHGGRFNYEDVEGTATHKNGKKTVILSSLHAEGKSSFVAHKTNRKKRNNQKLH